MIPHCPGLGQGGFSLWLVQLEVGKVHQAMLNLGLSCSMRSTPLQPAPCEFLAMWNSLSLQNANLTFNHILLLLSQKLPLLSRSVGWVHPAVPNSHPLFLSLESCLGQPPMCSPPGVAAEVVHGHVPFVIQLCFIFSDVLKIIIFSGQKPESVS